jgi:hypothetical protein
LRDEALAGPDGRHVAFGGVAASFKVLNGCFLTATVPAGAGSGPITVAGPGGVATSPTDFTVP